MRLKSDRGSQINRCEQNNVKLMGKLHNISYSY
nr:MAG TPA: hypothetical protein [Caudoviricetes sp.]